jgi:hypothetical protein
MESNRRKNQKIEASKDMSEGPNRQLSRTSKDSLQFFSISPPRFNLLVELCYMNLPIPTSTVIVGAKWVRYSRKKRLSWSSQSKSQKRLQDSFNRTNIATSWTSSTLSALVGSVTGKNNKFHPTLYTNSSIFSVDLPQIIVCGSQSSGKSSTLESISGIAFPTAEGRCTRFVTELILRRGDKPEPKVQIQLPLLGPRQNELNCSNFTRVRANDMSFPKIIEAAKITMGLSGTGRDSKVFSTDVLRIESTSPNAPNLTLLDLPGCLGPVTRTSKDIELSRLHSRAWCAVVATTA